MTKSAGLLPSKPGLLFSSRLNLSIMICFGTIITYALRGNISIAMVCMVKPKIETDSGLSTPTQTCTSVVNNTFLNLKFLSSDVVNEIEMEKEFDWSQKIQGFIFSAFYWGYTVSQIPGGYMAQRFGGKRIIGYTVCASSILTLISPAIARLNIYLFIFIRFILGVLQGSVFPAILAMWAVWSPPLERGLLTGLSYAGAQIGNVVLMSLSGFLCKYGFDGGWASIFYLFGLAGVIWFVIWQVIVFDSPQKHPRISKEECAYIVQSLNNSEKDVEEPQTKFPLWETLTSKAVWACFIGHFAGDWGAYTMASGFPSFLNDAISLDLITMGMIASIPYIVYFIVINFAGSIADNLQKKNILSTLNTRRVSMIVALGGQAFFLLLINVVDCGQKLVLILLLIASLGISGFQYSGFLVNYLEICPLYASTVIGIGQTISSLSGVFSALVIGYLTEHKTLEEWQNVFNLTSFILITGAIIFSVFVKVEVQSWAKPKKNKKEEVLLPFKIADPVPINNQNQPFAKVALKPLLETENDKN